MSKAADKYVSAKMHKMAKEDRPQAQKVAIALSEARRQGFKIPKKLVDKEKRAKK